MQLRKEKSGRSHPTAIWSVLEHQCCILYPFWYFTYPLKCTWNRLCYQSSKTFECACYSTKKTICSISFSWMSDKPSYRNFYASVKRKSSILKSFKKMNTFLVFDFLSSLNKFLIHCHIRNSSWYTLTNCLETIASSCNNISCEENSTLNNSYCPFDWAFNKTLSRLIDNFPGSLSKHPYKDIGVSKQVYRAEHFINSFHKLHEIEISKLRF